MQRKVLKDAPSGSVNVMLNYQFDLTHVSLDLQLLDTGFFHADPHPGNLIRTPDGKLAILDFGNHRSS